MYRILSCVLIVFLFSYCVRKPTSQSVHPSISNPSKVTYKNKPVKNLFDSVNLKVVQQIQQIQKNQFITENKVADYSKRLSAIYGLNNNQTFWLSPNRIDEVLKVLKESSTDGLNPDDYQYTVLFTSYNKLKEKNDNVQQAFDLEVLLTYNLLKYSRHMIQGKVNPTAVFSEWNYPLRSENSISDTLFAKIFSGKLDLLIDNIRPNHPIYKSLQGTLGQIDTMEVSEINWQIIKYTGSPLQIGDTALSLIEVKKHLRALGIYHTDSIDFLFDKGLGESIKDFQKHSGISSTGILDKKTLNALNFTLPELRNTVLANLERSRWILHDLPNDYIWVNIADYTLTHIKNNKEVYKEAVIVGKEVHQTPVFEALLTYIEFNPYWTVPASIAIKEILPQLKLHPDYLVKHNMQLYMNNDSVASPSSFASYDETNFPFTIKQKPGDDNSLGKVKFIFPNPYSVYLHDTPSKYLFAKDQRTFSHGCIRLKNPINFAYHLLSQQGYTSSQISEIVYSGKNQVISLDTKIPIMIIYFTCYSKSGDKHMYFLKDIYGNDQKIVQLLNK